MTPRVVIGASVLVAAVLSSNRRSASCVLIEAAALGVIRAVVSAPIVAEYRRKMEHPQVVAGAKIADPVALALDLARVAEMVEPTPVRVVINDPSDDVYLGTALAGRANYLATFDRRHLLSLDPYQGIRVVTPGDILRALRSR